MTKLPVSKNIFFIIITLFVDILNSVALCKYGETTRVRCCCLFRHLNIQVSDEKFRHLNWAWIFWIVSQTHPDHMNRFSTEKSCGGSPIQPPPWKSSSFEFPVKAICGLDRSYYKRGSCVSYQSSHEGSSDPATQFVVAATAYFCQRYAALAVTTGQINWDML